MYLQVQLAEQFPLVNTVFCINAAFLFHEFSKVVNIVIVGLNPELAHCS